MKDVKKKKNGWIWLFGGIVLSALLFLGLHYSGAFRIYGTGIPSQPLPFVREQGTRLIQSLGARLVDWTAQVHFSTVGNLESMVSQLTEKLGIGVDYVALFSILLVSITLVALVVGWYIRRFGKKKWLGYLISFIGFLPILAIMIAGSLVFWLGKQYWKSGKVRARKASTAKEPINKPTTIIDDWEQSFKGLES
ncbi:hypothetical protein QFZ87_000709 [Bacillus sp. SLBN-46]|uniref:hypothetical protein n=1 Tax=Bacillus sp. SLBN-46 TaxID=3042283 RepID=UPI0028573877|nr:hypothetical protein [Bacillus sp. SLBN-46]MDR6121112.1 hypothetical protein [Bacillus sp. SLBN-46]